MAWVVDLESVELAFLQKWLHTVTRVFTILGAKSGWIAKQDILSWNLYKAHYTKMP